MIPTTSGKNIPQKSAFTSRVKPGAENNPHIKPLPHEMHVHDGHWAGTLLKCYLIQLVSLWAEAGTPVNLTKQYR